MTMLNAILIAPIFAGWALIAVLLYLEERDLRRTYELLGTTGFYDVDERMRKFAKFPGISATTG
jgi:hypothetical protein